MFHTFPSFGPPPSYNPHTDSCDCFAFSHLRTPPSCNPHLVFDECFTLSLVCHTPKLQPHLNFSDCFILPPPRLLPNYNPILLVMNVSHIPSFATRPSCGQHPVVWPCRPLHAVDVYIWCSLVWTSPCGKEDVRLYGMWCVIWDPCCHPFDLCVHV